MFYQDIFTGDPYWLPSPRSSFLSSITQSTDKLKVERGDGNQ